MNISFCAKKVFVTGGSRGIGRKICEIFVENGAEVLAPSRQEMDLSDEKSINEYLEKSDFEPDIIVHCAGVNKLSGITEIDKHILDEVFQVNCFSAVGICKKYVKSMIRNKSGKIVFISSLYSMVSRERRLAYSASKNALTGVMKTLALELAEHNIMVNAVAPGYVMTDMTRKNLSQEDICNIESQIPTHRFQSEDDVANMVMYLCSDYNNNITGQLIAVDGGFLCR